MRWLALYLRSRRVPAALAVAAGSAVVLWSLWSIFSDSPDAGLPMVVLSILILAVAVSTTFTSPDGDLDRTAALAWRPRRALHVVAALAVVLLLLLATLATGARFGPAAVVLRDAAGLLGLAALGAATLGASRSWFLPLGWTLAVMVFPPMAGTAGHILTWQVQATDSTAAAATAAVFGVLGMAAYALAGPLRRPPAEAAM